MSIIVALKKIYNEIRILNILGSQINLNFARVTVKEPTLSFSPNLVLKTILYYDHAPMGLILRKILLKVGK